MDTFLYFFFISILFIVRPGCLELTASSTIQYRQDWELVFSDWQVDKNKKKLIIFENEKIILHSSAFWNCSFL